MAYLYHLVSFLMAQRLQVYLMELKELKMGKIIRPILSICDLRSYNLSVRKI